MGHGNLLINDAEGWLNQAKKQFEAGDFEGAIACGFFSVQSHLGSRLG